MYTPHTQHDVEVMLTEIGAERIEDLFREIPSEYRFPKLNLPDPLTELEALRELEEIASANGTSSEMISFL